MVSQARKKCMLLMKPCIIRCVSSLPAARFPLPTTNPRAGLATNRIQASPHGQSRISFSGLKPVNDTESSPKKGTAPDLSASEDVDAAVFHFLSVRSVSVYELDHETCLPCWTTVSNFCLRLTSSNVFQGVITFFIVLAGVTAGINTMEDLDETTSTALLWTDFFILLVFTVEVILKMIGEGSHPWMYFWGVPPPANHVDEGREDMAWNIFDFVLVLACWLFEFNVLGSSFGSPAVLRLFRLARLVKLIRAVPELQTIVGGLLSGMSSIFYIFLLLVLVLYLYAITGITFFRSNDPAHFANLGIAFVTLFRLSTLEDWTDVMYINMYGCDSYGYPVGSRDFVSGMDLDWQCTHPKAQYTFAMMYFVSFILVSALVMMSLFVGVITMGMQISVDEMREQSEADKRSKLMVRAREQHALNSAKGQRMARLALLAWKGEDISREIAHAKDEIAVNEASKTPNCFHKLTTHPCFEAFILIVIVFASLMVGVQTDKGIAESQAGILDLTEDIILVIFTVEMLLKVFAECPQPWLYLNERWNIFDFFLVIMSFLKYVPSAGLANASKMFFVLRLLRLLRVLKLMKSIPPLQVIVYGLLKGMSSISYIMLLLLFVFYTFGVTSIIFFRANDPWHFSDLATSMVTLFRIATGEDWTDVMYINMYGCDAYGYESQALAPLCTAPKAMGFFAAVYFIFFFFIASLCILTLFVGVVTTSMDEQRQEMEHKVKLQARVKEIMKTEEVTAERLLSYREIFSLFDADDSGEVDDTELLLAMRAIGLTPTRNQVNGMMLEVDSDNNGAIDFAEFVHFMVICERRNSKLSSERKEDTAAHHRRSSVVGKISDGVHAGVSAVKSGISGVVHSTHAPVHLGLGGRRNGAKVAVMPVPVLVQAFTDSSSDYTSSTDSETDSD